MTESLLVRHTVDAPGPAVHAEPTMRLRWYRPDPSSPIVRLQQLWHGCWEAEAWPSATKRRAARLAEAKARLEATVAAHA